MTSARRTPLNDDSGDRFPGAVPATTAPTTERPAGADDRLVRMTAAYTEKVNAAVEADREGLAHELAERTFLEELSGSAAGSASRRPARRTSFHGHRPPTALGRMGTLTRRSLARFDRYTLDVFNPRPPHALYARPSDHSA